MKKSILCVFFFAAVNVHAQKPVSKVTLSKEQGVKLGNAEDTMQYVIGVHMAKWMAGNGFQISNPVLLMKGMNDVLLTKPRLIPDSIVASLVNVYQQQGQKNRATKLEQQLFESLRDKPGVGVFPNAVRYIILKNGSGPRPSERDSITLNILAKLADGTVVEDTYQTKKPFETIPKAFFPGLSESLLFMAEGSKWQLFVPAVLAYQEKGTALIPPYSALVLEVELLAVKSVKK